MTTENAAPPPVDPSRSPLRPPPTRNSRATRILLGITLMGLVVFAVSLFAVYSLMSGKDRGKITDDTFVRVTLAGDLPDSPPPPELFGDPSRVRATVTELASAIRASSRDERIKGLYLVLDMPSAGWGRLGELRASLEAFRAAGKPCVAYAEILDDPGYYLASACDRVVLAPSGISMVNGLASSITYYAGTFEKLGIEPEFEHVGDFKSAVEPYERSAPSEPAAEAMNVLLDGLYGTLVSDIARGRGLSDEAVRAMIDAAPMSPRDALSRGLVDALAFPDAVAARVHLSTEENWAATLDEPIPDALREALDKRFTPISEFVKKVRSEHADKSVKIAVVHAEGPILSGESDGGLFGAQVLADRTFRAWMKEARENDAVKAVVLRVNSPGGSGLASDMMWREVKLTQAAGKPVVVSMADYAASGGYYISAPADWIVAQPNTVTGSIGVFGGKLNLGGAFEKLGMTEHQFKRGELSDLFSSTSGFSERGRETYRRFLHDFYEIFLDRVGEGRKLDRDAAHAVAQGRVWTGTQALERGLVDELGGLDEALAKAAGLAGLADGSWGVQRLPRQKDLFELLMEDFNRPEASVRVELGAPFEAAADEIEHLLLLDAMLTDGPVALLPGRLSID